MWRPCWTWTAVASAALIGIAAAVVAVSAAPARSDDEEEAHVAPNDFVILADALANWDDSSESERETALAAYLGAQSRDDEFAPFEDPSWMEPR